MRSPYYGERNGPCYFLPPSSSSLLFMLSQLLEKSHPLFFYVYRSKECLLEITRAIKHTFQLNENKLSTWIASCSRFPKAYFGLRFPWFFFIQGFWKNFFGAPSRHRCVQTLKTPTYDVPWSTYVNFSISPREGKANAKDGITQTPFLNTPTLLLG